MCAASQRRENAPQTRRFSAVRDTDNERPWLPPDRRPGACHTRGPFSRTAWEWASRRVCAFCSAIACSPPSPPVSYRPAAVCDVTDTTRNGRNEQEHFDIVGWRPLISSRAHPPFRQAARPRAGPRARADALTASRCAAPRGTTGKRPPQYTVPSFGGFRSLGRHSPSLLRPRVSLAAVRAAHALVLVRRPPVVRRRRLARGVIHAWH